MIDRERIEEFVELHRIQLVVALGAILAVFAIILIIAIGHGVRGKDLGRGRARIDPGNLKPGQFWLPEEPLAVPGVLLFREPEAKWSVDEIKRWYTVPDTEALAELRQAGKKKVDQILESVP